MEEVYSEVYDLPFEIAQMAVEDADPNVRAWIARKGRGLDYREPSSIENGSGKTDVYRYPERNLKDRLKSDPDPYVRACLRENEHVFWLFGSFSDHYEQLIREATQLERLALMRNPSLNVWAVQKLLDLEDQEFGLSQETRRELLLAALMNPKLRSDSKSLHEHSPVFWNLWELALAWPPDSGIPGTVFWGFGANDATKAKVYSECKDSILRQTILQACAPSDDSQTIQLGMKDADAECRRIAWSKVADVPLEDLSKLINAEETDKHVLLGLADNPNVSLNDHAYLCLRLDDYLGLPALGTLAHTRHLNSLVSDASFEDFFIKRSPTEVTLEEKVGWIAHQLLGLKESASQTEAKQGKIIARLGSLLTVGYVLLAVAIYWVLRRAF